MQALFAKTGRLIRHPALIGSVLTGSLLAFCLHPGSLGDLMTAVSILFVLNAVSGGYPARTATTGHRVMLGIMAGVALIHLAAPEGMTHASSLRYFLLFPGMVMAYHCLARRFDGRRLGGVFFLMAVVLFVAVAAQMVAYWVNQGTSRFGVYSNRHHLGLFASLAAPVLSEAVFRFAGWRRALFAAGMFGAMYLLWQSDSRVAWISFLAGTVSACLLFFRKKQLAVALAFLIAVTGFTVVVSGPATVSVRLGDLARNLPLDERMHLWPETLSRLEKNTVAEWLLGRGIGSFHYHFADYALLVGGVSVHFGFPHNAVLQIVFENGLLGLGLTAAGVVGLMVALFRSFHWFTRPADRRAVMQVFCLLCIVLLHCLLTKSVYSKYVLYSLGLIVGAALVAVEEAKTENLNSAGRALS
jgi:O-antigen ligase